MNRLRMIAVATIIATLTVFSGTALSDQSKVGAIAPLTDLYDTVWIRSEDGSVKSLEQVADDSFMQSDARIHEGKYGASAELLAGHKVGFPMTLEPRKRAVVQMDISAPKNAKPGDSFTTKFMQRTLKGETVGEWDITVNIVEKRG